MLFAKYNAKDTTVTADGVNITGFGEDMLTIDKDEEEFTVSVGAQGDIVKNEVNNSLGTTSLTVQITSPQYGYLMELVKREDPFPFWYTNKKLGERSGGTMANIKKQPSMNRGTQAEDGTFEIQIYDLVNQRI